jgi:hypothetical protein
MSAVDSFMVAYSYALPVGMGLAVAWMYVRAAIDWLRP